MEGLDASVGGAGFDTDTGVNEGLSARKKPGFNGLAFSAATGAAAFGKVKGVIIASAD